MVGLSEKVLEILESAVGDIKNIETAVRRYFFNTGRCLFPIKGQGRIISLKVQCSYQLSVFSQNTFCKLLHNY